MDIEVQAQRRGGLACARTIPRENPRLNLDQKLELAIVIRQGPENSGLDTGVWMAPIIVDLVKRRFRSRSLSANSLDSLPN